jgi:hypothetical protein
MYYRDFFPDFLTLAQRAFAKAESLALAAALIFFLFAGALAAGFTGFAAGFVPLTFAHRALAAALILARAAALIFLGALADADAGAPRIEASCLCNASIFPLRSIAWRSCAVVNDSRLLIVV